MIKLKEITGFSSKSTISSEFCCYQEILYLYTFTSTFLLSDRINQTISREIFLSQCVEHKNRL